MGVPRPAPLGLFDRAATCRGYPPPTVRVPPPWEDSGTGACLLEGAGVFTNVPCDPAQLWPVAPLAAAERYRRARRRARE